MRTLKSQINEGIFDAFKVSMMFTKLQGKILSEAIELAKKKEYSNADDLMRDTKPVAQKLFKEYIGKLENTISFNDWWKVFAEACGEQVMDEILDN